MRPRLAVLNTLPRIKGNPFVIAGTRDGALSVGSTKYGRGCRKPLALDGVRLHDLRHSFASVAAARWGQSSDHRRDARPQARGETSIYAHL